VREVTGFFIFSNPGCLIFKTPWCYHLKRFAKYNPLSCDPGPNPAQTASLKIVIWCWRSMTIQKSSVLCCVIITNPTGVNG